ncbi:hypothetical protein CYLTODRAFT_381628 [Cylindrobasidium torrendii FP15055 ss-10]|uniref:DUF6535 domain-containing protein n=1 Tax=Cylindrobasidium torrendii FP15055 ss-10 TaxID=1314674 RepID=A0A0D7B0X7_9AGAR|nr:hypothetical protein CYLTODRAFT_381628 [Cylindrobasidium torrendii FP15055 ss-10]
MASMLNDGTSTDPQAIATVLQEILEAVRQLHGATDGHASSAPMNGDNVEKRPRTAKVFGMSSEQAARNNPLAALYDYNIKYPHTERYHELDDDARVWVVYNDEAKQFDDDSVSEWGDSLDILLVFAGLFSAVLTTFVVETSTSLSQDPADVSAAYLSEMIAIQRAAASGHNISDVPAADLYFSPSGIDLWVNALWFTSLTLSLSVALFAVLAKQWIRQYMSTVTGTPRERALIRQYRLDGVVQWRVQAIIGVLPILLHISLILFLVGIVIFLAPLNGAMAWVTGSITFLATILYLAASVFPVFVLQCPYRTTFIDLLFYAAGFLRTLRGGRSKRPAAGPIFRSLKDLERAYIRKALEHGQDMQLNALNWLARSTSSSSAKEIIRRSLGAFMSSMTSQLGMDSALRHLYQFPHEMDFFESIQDAQKDEAKAENLYRSALHRTWFTTFHASVAHREGHEIDTEDVELALCAKAAGMRSTNAKISHLFDPDTFLRSWLARDGSPEVPALVWFPLLAQIFKENPWPALSAIPDATLDHVYAVHLSLVEFQNKETPYPMTLLWAVTCMSSGLFLTTLLGPDCTSDKLEGEWCHRRKDDLATQPRRTHTTQRYIAKQVLEKQNVRYLERFVHIEAALLGVYSCAREARRGDEERVSAGGDNPTGADAVSSGDANG